MEQRIKFIIVHVLFWNKAEREQYFRTTKLVAILNVSRAKFLDFKPSATFTDKLKVVPIFGNSLPTEMLISLKMQKHCLKKYKYRHLLFFLIVSISLYKGPISLSLSPFIHKFLPVQISSEAVSPTRRRGRGRGAVTLRRRIRCD